MLLFSAGRPVWERPGRWALALRARCLFARAGLRGRALVARPEPVR
ncbi:hypothetical protein C791_4107 [Amycolatopsis azurea DSM 43854]|uniref:Uncharacterized protein n=1 Tax=Amycolatopsis azurea DSM 43854 TaxID=1238180 RepID=M2NTR2_9PSEU|nr:hypothetical protein C791_4107 [Amycolatopsis azurea DSM 43854]